MSGQKWWAIGVALLSLLLLLGWFWQKKQQPDDARWEELERQWPGHLAHFLYFVGLPYAAIVFGVLTPRLLGLKGLENFVLIDFRDTALFVGQVQYAVTLMLLEWLIDSASTIVAGMVALVILTGILFGLTRFGFMFANSFRVTVWDTVYHSFHWAFYRAVFWLLTGDLYLGVILGVSFVMLEWFLVAWLDQTWQTQSQQLWLNSIVLILTGAVFFYSPNLWLLWPVHLAMVMLIKRAGPAKTFDYSLSRLG